MESLLDTLCGQLPGSLCHELPGFSGQLPVTFFFMLPIFWAAVMILNRFMLEPVIATVERRKAASSGTSEGAAHLQAEAGRLLGDHSAAVRKGGDEAAAAREKVIAATRTEIESTLSQARQAAEKSVTEARTAIRAESDTARTQLKAEVEKIAAEMARKLLGRAA